MKNLEIFFDIFDFHACLYMHIKFRQNRTKFGSVRASFSKTGRHGISIFTNFNHLRIIFESGYMRWLLSFFLPQVHLRLTVYIDLRVESLLHTTIQSRTSLSTTKKAYSRPKADSIELIFIPYPISNVFYIYTRRLEWR